LTVTTPQPDKLSPHLASDPEILAQYARDPVYQGSPDFVFRGTDLKTTAEILLFANQKKIPVTFCGSQTAMTGAGVADSGIALTLNPFNKLIDIGTDRKTGETFAICEPGILLGDLKQQVWDAGYFYPPDPTSFREATLGGTIATNATGADTFKYGPTRSYISELQILTAQGLTKTLSRSQPLVLQHFKNKAGYFLDGEEIDHMIGSEGTLGLITQIKIRLLPNQGRDVFYMVLPFSCFEKSLQAVSILCRFAQRPRALEWIGPGAAPYFQSSAACPESLQHESCFLYLKDEFIDANDLQKKIKTWFEQLTILYKNLGEPKSLDRVFVATTQKQKDDLHTARHHIPLKVNEEYFPYTKIGGGKIGTDWWVPQTHLLQMMLSTYRDAVDAKIPFLVFGHIGDGHPHWDFLCRNADEHAKATALVEKQCRQAVQYGGGVAGEHGIGKLKKKLLSIQHPPEIIAKMQAIKNRWDPQHILGCGNIFG